MASSPRRDPAPSAAENNDDPFDNYSVADDPFATDLPVYKPPPPPSNKRTAAAAALGIDSAVEVAKKARTPRAKLDEERLLGPPGIPKLRTRAAALRLRGRRHEYSDAAELLRFYQLWLDDLFPKARFLDALAMVEKLGHKKRIQLMRRAWIDGGRPGAGGGAGGGGGGGGGAEDGGMDGLFDDPTLPLPAPRELRVAPIFERRPQTPRDDVPDDVDDLYDASPRRAAAAPTHTSIFGNPAPRDEFDDVDDDDALAALLAEAEMDASTSAATTAAANPAPRRRQQQQLEDDEDDDLDALMAEAERDAATAAGGKGGAGGGIGGVVVGGKRQQRQEEEEEGDDLDALMAEAEMGVATTTTTVPDARRRQQEEDADEDEDDMDALAAMGGWGGE